MKKILPRLLTFWIATSPLGIGAGHVCLAAGEEDLVQLIQMKTVLDTIPELKWGAKSAKIEVVSVPEGEAYFVSVPGSFNAEDTALLTDREQVAISEKGDFLLKIPVKGENSSVDFLSVSPFGTLKREKLGVSFPGWNAFLAKRKSPALGTRRFFVTPSLGLTLINYTQTGLTPFSETALTGKVSALYYLAPRWDIGLASFFTLIPVTSTVPENKIRFLGVNGRIGYVVPWVKSPWRLSLMTGVYFTTTFVPGSTFGFENMTGPQLFPVLTRVWNNGRSSTFYFKFSPVTAQFTPLALSNREIAGGGSYGFRLKNGHAMSIAMDVSSIQLTLENTQIKATTFSLGVGYSM
ncbi:MAG: hypothetical protein AABZ55_12065 [Bdellovibrionota bacterium]